MFRFKRFAIDQKGAAMKVGTDGVLLGAWCRVESWQQRILDVGCGTGLIALMAAQRSEEYSSVIDALELDTGAYGQALVNVANSPWPREINVYNTSFQSFVVSDQNRNYQHIISNPPYFNSSLACPQVERNLARHTDSLSHEELLYGIARLLSEDGIFSVILPTDSFDSFVSIARANGLYPTRITDVYPTDYSPSPKRTLAEFSFANVVAARSLLLIEQGGRHCYSRDYVELTKDFYLKFG